MWLAGMAAVTAHQDLDAFERTNAPPFRAGPRPVTSSRPGIGNGGESSLQHCFSAIWTYLRPSEAGSEVAPMALNQTSSRDAPVHATKQRLHGLLLFPGAHSPSVSPEKSCSARRSSSTGRDAHAPQSSTTCAASAKRNRKQQCGKKACVRNFAVNSVVPAYARGAAISQNIDGRLGTFVLGFDQQELPAMRERHGVGFDNFVGQAIVGQMGLKGPNDSLMIWLTMRGCFGRSPNRRRSRTRSEDQPETMPFSSNNPLIEDAVFEAGPRQARNRLIHITGIVKYGDDRSHQSRYGAAIVTKRMSVARYFALAERAWHGRKQSWIESWSNKGRAGK